MKLRKEIANPEVAVTLRLGAPVKAAQACLPNDGTHWRSLSLNAGALALTVPDRLLVVKLTRP